MENYTNVNSEPPAAAAGSSDSLWIMIVPMLILQICQLVLSLANKIRKSECCGGKVEFRSGNSVRAAPVVNSEESQV